GNMDADGDDDDGIPSGLVYYTDLTTRHPVVTFFQGSSRLDSFIWNDLAYSGHWDESGFLKLVIRPHVASLHFWERSCHSHPFLPMSVLLVHNNIASHVFTDHFDGIVVTPAVGQLFQELLPADQYAAVRPKIFEVDFGFFADDIEQATTRLLALCNERQWSHVATTVYGADEALMDTVYEWEHPFPSDVTVFYSNSGDIASIVDGFKCISKNDCARSQRSISVDSYA
ncbi:hypothetical protein DIPPA_08692, partial [Diplonema papillatum]